METQSTPTVIPSVNDLVIPGGGQSYRIAHGMFVRGEEIEESVIVAGVPKKIGAERYPEEVTKVCGLLRRVGIHQTPNQYGTPYRFDVDIETAEGPFLISLNLLGADKTLKPSVSALSLAWAVLQFKKDELMVLETKLGPAATLADGSTGGKPTYVNPFRIEGTTVIRIDKPKRDPAAPRTTPVDQWRNELEPQIRSHGAFAPRPVTRADEADGGPAQSHLAALNAECAAKGWPTPDQQPSAWLTRLAQVNGHGVRARLSDYSDDEWGDVRGLLQDVAECPDFLRPFLGGAAPQPPAQSGLSI